MAIAGNLVNGHWWDGPECIEHMGAHMYEGWKRRMQAHGLPYYVRHKNRLFITVETFEERAGELHTTATGAQLDWFNGVLWKHAHAGVGKRLLFEAGMGQDGQDAYWGREQRTAGVPPAHSGCRRDACGTRARHFPVRSLVPHCRGCLNAFGNVRYRCNAMEWGVLFGKVFAAAGRLATWILLHVLIGAVYGTFLGGFGGAISGEYVAFGASFGLPIGALLSAICGIVSGVTMLALDRYARKQLLMRLGVFTVGLSLPVLLIPELGVVLSVLGAIIGYFIGLGLFWSRRLQQRNGESGGP